MNAILLALLAVFAASRMALAAGETCAPSETVTLDHVTERGELQLVDGRLIRLAGLDLTRAPPEDGTWQTFLASLTRSATIRLGSLAGQDRWGRIAAEVHVRPEEATSEAWLQGFLLEIGAARLSPEPEARDCWALLKAAEDKAREGRTGLWAAAGAVLPGDDPGSILAKRGQLAMVEGKIIGIGESRAVFYLNFGRSWRNDFAVLILKRQARSFDSAGLKPAAFVGKHVRIRGIVDGQTAPRIELTVPEQVELLD